MGVVTVEGCRATADACAERLSERLGYAMQVEPGDTPDRWRIVALVGDKAP